MKVTFIPADRGDFVMKFAKYVVFNNLTEELISCDTQEELAEAVADCYVSGGTPVSYKEV